MQLPIVRLKDKKVYKVIYKGKKWSFEQGIDYEDLHPSFSAHLSKLRDDQGNLLFEIDNCAKLVTLTRENSYDAVSKDEIARVKVKRKTQDFKEKLALAKEKRLNKESQLNSGGIL